jgi:hypothetical protein
MVEERLEDGRRIAGLLASEVDGRTDGALGRLSVVDADREVEPTADGAFAYGIEADGERLADVHVHPDRAHLEFALERAHEAVVDAADREGLRVRPKAVDPPRTLVFVEDGAQVKRALATIEAALAG